MHAYKSETGPLFFVESVCNLLPAKKENQRRRDNVLPLRQKSAVHFQQRSRQYLVEKNQKMPFVAISGPKSEEISVVALKSLLRTLARAMGKREITMIWILEHCSAAEDPPEKVSVRIEAFDALEEEEERKEVESVVKDHFGQETLVELRLIQPHWVGALGEACKSLKSPADGDR